MTLIIEDGSVVTGANSYASLATVTAYHVARGNSAWLGSDEDAEPAILRAMNYMEALPWNGVKTARDNPLSWPRYGMYDREGYAIDTDDVPQVVVNALCEAAYRELQTAGILQPDDTRDGMLTSISVAGAVSLAWAAGAPRRTNFRIITDMLKGLIATEGGIQLVRG